MYEAKLERLVAILKDYYAKGDYTMASHYERRIQALKKRMESLNSLECKTVSPPITSSTVVAYYSAPQQEKKEETMDLNYTRLEHLRRRMDDAYYSKKADLRKHFHMDDDAAPANAIEFIERIQAGKFVMPKKDDARMKNYSIREQIEWRTEPKDEAGYEAAKKLLKDAYNAAKDVIIIKDAEAGLAAYQDFASKTFH